MSDRNIKTSNRLLYSCPIETQHNAVKLTSVYIDRVYFANFAKYLLKTCCLYAMIIPAANPRFVFAEIVAAGTYPQRFLSASGTQTIIGN